MSLDNWHSSHVLIQCYTTACYGQSCRTLSHGILLHKKIKIELYTLVLQYSVIKHSGHYSWGGARLLPQWINSSWFTTIYKGRLASKLNARRGVGNAQREYHYQLCRELQNSSCERDSTSLLSNGRCFLESRFVTRIAYTILLHI